MRPVLKTLLNLNADMGESFGPYEIGDDEGLLDVVQSASVACGFHGGDPTVMVNTILAAKARGVSIGAHPGFNDLWGFGRRQIRMNLSDLENMVLYQIAAIDGVARTLGHPITHVKAHGALNNMACEDAGYADAVARATKAFNPDLVFVAVALSELAKAGERHGLPTAVEGFADRTYQANGMLTPRSQDGAVIRDPEQAREQVFSMAVDQRIPTAGGYLDTPIHTICHHGDEPTAVAVAREVRKAVEASDNIDLIPLPVLFPG
ncbi:MAG: 5-oxoprolinase subunit PxpA [Pseudomonadota bacterium]